MGGSIRLCTAAFWLIAVMLPMFAMLSKMAGVDIAALLSSRGFSQALQHSLCVGVVATLISVSLAGLLAWCTTRTRMRGGSVFPVLLTLPMLIPSISHGMGLITLFGSNGVIRNLFNLTGTIYGFWGIVIGSVMYAFPVAYLMLVDVLRYEDSTPYEAADVLGLSKRDKLNAVTLPYLRKPLISVLFATFTLIVTDYGVPLMIGGKYNTLPVIMYQDVIGLLDFGKGSVIGAVLLIPALIACVLDQINRDKGNLSFVSKPFVIKKTRARDTFALVVCLIVCGCVVLPIGAFAFLSVVNKYPLDMGVSLRNVKYAFEMDAGVYMRNSVLIALAVAAVGSAAATFTAYLTARMRSRASTILHLLSISTLAIPGIVLGLSYALFFKGSILYGTFAILIMVNMMHFFSSPYLMMYNTFGKLNENLEAVGMTLGVSRWEILRDVLLPQVKGTILEMASYFFVNCMMTISAVSFLATVATKPVALMITQFEGQMQLESAAFVALMILAVNVLVMNTVVVIKRAMCKREAR